MNERIYVAIAYRWGYLNLHHYLIAAGCDKEKIVALAQCEADDRGGKYGCVVYEMLDSSATETMTEVAYSPSSWGEGHPHHNYRIDFYETLGHKLAEVVERGVTGTPTPDPTLIGRNGKPMSVIKDVPVEVPQWAKDRYAEAKMVLDTMEKTQRER